MSYYDWWLQCTHNIVAQGIRNTANLFDSKVAVQPLRTPRTFGVDRVLAPYDVVAAIGALGMRNLDNGVFAKVK